MIHKIFRVIEGYSKLTIFYLIALIFLSLLLESASLGLLIPVIGYFSSPEFSEIINLQKIFYLLPDLELSKKKFFNILLLSILIFFSLRFIFSTYLTLKLHSFIGTSTKIICEKLLRIYVSKSYKWHTGYNKTDFIHILTRDVENFTANTLFGFLFIVSELFLFMGVIIFLLFFNAKIFLNLLIVSILFFPILYFFTKKFSFNLGKKVIDNQSKMLRGINESLSGIKELVLYNWSEKVTKHFRTTIDPVVKSYALHNSLQDISRFVLEYLAVILFIIFIFTLNTDVSGQNGIITIGIFAAALFRLMPIMNRLSTYAQRFKYGAASIDKILDFYKYDLNKTEYKHKTNINFNKLLSLKNIEFRYSSTNQKILKNINLEIKKNEIVGIIGESGVGKTTLSNILMGLLEPTNGEIIVDGKNIKKNNLSIKNNIAFVSQNFFHLDATLLENITFFEKKINFSNLKFAIKNSLLIKPILEKNLSLKTKMGNQAMKISGGQLQRVNIARALYRRPEILILDEPTSSLDIKNQQSFNKIIKKLKSKMTIIIISHNDNLINFF